MNGGGERAPPGRLGRLGRAEVRHRDPAAAAPRRRREVRERRALEGRRLALPEGRRRSQEQ